MTRRALVIGSQTGQLRGAECDAHAMCDALAARGFEIDLRVGVDASRDGILDGWKTLQSVTVDGDAVVVYYSGHGGRVCNLDPDVVAGRRHDVPRETNFIVPTDYEVGASEFRGITEWESSFQLAAITMRTRNVVVIHDCCFAESMIRGNVQSHARSLPQRARHNLRGYFEALLQHGARFDTLYPQGNPHAVRVAAATRTQLAWELAGRGGRYSGAFTSAIVALLDEIGSDLATWAWMLQAVRQRLLRLPQRQRPEIHGPAGRALFSLAQVGDPDEVAVVVRDKAPYLLAGWVHDVQIGDTFRIVPVLSRHRSAKPITAAVCAVRPFEALLEVDGALHRDSVVIARPMMPRPHPVSLAERLRSLEGEHGLVTSALAVTLVSAPWQLAERSTVIKDHGVTLAIRIENRANHSTYVHVFAIHGGRVTHVSSLSASGVLLAPGAVELIGMVAGVGLVGIHLVEPASQPAEPALEPEIILIATRAPVDLCSLATPDPHLDAASARVAAVAPLHGAVAPTRRSNAVRDARVVDPPPDDASFLAIRIPVSTDVRRQLVELASLPATP